MSQSCYYRPRVQPESEWKPHIPSRPSDFGLYCVFCPVRGLISTERSLVNHLKLQQHNAQYLSNILKSWPYLHIYRLKSRTKKQPLILVGQNYWQITTLQQSIMFSAVLQRESHITKGQYRPTADTWRFKSVLLRAFASGMCYILSYSSVVKA